MKRAIFTTCTADHFQYFIPTWAWTAKKLWPDVTTIVRVYGREVDRDAMAGVDKVDVDVVIPKGPAATNCRRFLLRVSGEYDQVMITDCDVVFLNDDLWEYMDDKMSTLGSYAAWQGALNKPKRPKIAPNGWSGDMRRLAGGFVLVTPQWYNQTEQLRRSYEALVRAGQWGNYRESDEVMLCRICKDSGLTLPNNTGFHRSMRGLHLGDFKDSMAHRWGNVGKMGQYLPWGNVEKTKTLLMDRQFQGILKVACKDRDVATMWERVKYHVTHRKGGINVRR